LKAKLASLFIAAWYWANIRSWATLVLALNLRIEVMGLENVPKKGAFILASNHVNLADPPILIVKTPRRIAWMAKKELFDVPIIGLCYRFYGCLPVKRGQADLTALRKAQEALDRGLPLGMFPEGTRTGKPGLKEAEPGTALIALRTGVPVLPVAISGSEPCTFPGGLFYWLTRRQPKIRVVFGELFSLPAPLPIRKPDVEAGTTRIMREIAALLPPEYRGVYGEAKLQVSSRTKPA